MKNGTLASITGASLLAAQLVSAQIAAGTSAGEGAVGAGSSSEAAGYSCDPSQCRLPNCHCASTDIPGGLSRDETPMFITWTNDDAIQRYTIEAVDHFLAQRKNPNGCPVKSTYFVSLNYTNHSLVTDWYVSGNEIADHTMTHVGGDDATQEQINGNIAALNAFSGIPLNAISGFRAPYLNYTANVLRHLQSAQFTYDSSVSAVSPVTAPDTDAFWPYTLDYGLTNDCLNGIAGTCKGEPKIPGMWEIPMYTVHDSAGNPHLMDAYLDGNASDVQSWYRNTFTAHYENNRQPFGLYQHPIHLAVGYPGVEDPLEERAMINEFLDWAQQQQNVWIVTNQQLIAWMRDPKPVSQLNTIPEFQCQTPEVTENICNGMYPNQVGLLQNCPFADFPWTTCYGCPVEPPSPSNPIPAQASAAAGESLRYRLPNNCSTPFWDPIGNKCLCESDSCQFRDTTKPIGPNGVDLIGGGTGTSSDGSSTTSARPSYVPFGAAARSYGPSSATILCVAFTGIAALLGGLAHLA